MKDPIFIVGNSRSGTTLLARILKRHPNIYILNETHFIYQFREFLDAPLPICEEEVWKIVNTMLTIQRKDYYRRSEYEEYPNEADKIIKNFQSTKKNDFSTLNKIVFEYEASRHGKEWAGDQTPRHVFDILELLFMYPNAKFIHIVRNPCAVLLSQKNKWRAARRWGQPWFEVTRTFLNHHPVTTVLMWKKSVEAGLLAERTVSKQNIKMILYENLCEDPTHELQKLCDFLGIIFFNDMVNVDVEFSAKQKDEGIKGISKYISERWKNELNATEIFFAEKIAHKLMQSLGYNLIGSRPNLICLFIYILVWPFQLGIAFIMNISRMGKPLDFIFKRLFNKTLLPIKLK